VAASVTSISLFGRPIRSIMPRVTGTGVSASRNRANLILDDPPLIVRMNGLGSSRFMLLPLYHNRRPARHAYGIDIRLLKNDIDNSGIMLFFS
jgi:hypothetical protein